VLRLRAPIAVWLALSFAAGASAAEDPGKYRMDPGGKVRGVRLLDVDGDGRLDLVLLLESRQPPVTHEVVVLRTPAEAVPKTFFSASDALRLPCGEDLCDAGAVAVGRFGPAGAARLRFFRPGGILEIGPEGARAEPTERTSVPTLLGRSAGRAPVFWDAHADLDGDGVEEVWYPLAEGNGPIRVLGGTAAGDRTLDLECRNTASSTPEHLLVRTAEVPNLFPADLDGDGKKELLALRGRTLVAWPAGGAGGEGPVAPTFSVELPFVAPDDLAPEELRTPRLQVEDVDGDGKTDLLVTLVQGRRDQLGSMKTTLFHYPGPFRDPSSGRLVAPRVRIDTESVALHPRFVDLDGDGALDYVGDSIRGSKFDLIRRVMGAEPTIFFVAFRFDRGTKTFESTPYFTAERPYSSDQAVSNVFGQSAWFTGDFDGDGHKDMLDLGNLDGVEILRGARREGDGPGDPLAFSEWMPRVPTGKPLEPQAVVADLTGDGRSEAVMWNDEALFVVMPRGGS
jgi:hypothetical protein